MKTEFICEICGCKKSQLLGTREYTRRDLADSSNYRQKRLLVLFETWFPGTDAVRLSAQMCERCGFVSHLPRAESHDIDAKYQALERLGQDYGSTETDSVIVERSRVIHSTVAAVINARRPLRILDYGGGDGRLMRAFAAAGHKPSLIDYNSDPVPYVQKLGDTLSLVPKDETFDVIVANHVIEHVAEPTMVLRSLAQRLRAGGCLYVEVPMEIWARPPLQDEPVTHVNFFVPASLRRAHEEAGLTVLSSRLLRSMHSSGVFNLAIRTVSRQDFKRVNAESTGGREVRRYLQPSRLERLRRRVLLAGGVAGLVSRAARRATSLK